MKIGRKTNWSAMVAVTGALFLALAFASPAAQAASVQVTAETIQVVEIDDFANVEFSLTVTNGTSVLASDVYVVFEDGVEVSVGDIAAGGSASSAPQTLTIDLLQMPTRNSPLPVTLNFTLDGVYEELPATLVVHLGVPAGDGL